MPSATRSNRCAPLTTGPLLCARPSTHTQPANTAINAARTGTRMEPPFDSATIQQIAGGTAAQRSARRHLDEADLVRCRGGAVPQRQAAVGDLDGHGCVQPPCGAGRRPAHSRDAFGTDREGGPEIRWITGNDADVVAAVRD